MPYREDEHGLGPLRSVHRWRLTPAFALVGASLIGLGALIAAPYSEPTHPLAWLGSAALVLLGVGAFGIAMWMRRNRIELYERGLFHRWAGREVRVPYDRITSISKDSTPSGHHVVLRHEEGALVVTHGLERIEALIRDLEARTFHARLARAEARMEQGAAAFGAIRLDPQMLTIHGSKLAATELTRIERHEQLGEAKVSIHVRSQARWRTLRDIEVDDADVLVALVERLSR